MEKALFLAAFFFAYTVQAITGFAGNIFAMPVGTTLLGLESTVAVLNAMGVFACGLLAVTNLKSVNWRELGKMLAVMAVFMFVGIWLDTVMPLHVLLKLYGVVLVAIGAKNLLRPQTRFLPEWALWVVLALAGLVQGMFVSGGALLVIYAVQKLRDRQQFRITLSAVWTVLNFLYAVIAFRQGHYTGDVLQVVALCIPLAVVATVLGSKLQKRISQERFLKFTYVLILCIGGLLLVTGQGRRGERACPLPAARSGWVAFGWEKPNLVEEGRSRVVLEGGRSQVSWRVLTEIRVSPRRVSQGGRCRPGDMRSSCRMVSRNAGANNDFPSKPATKPGIFWRGGVRGGRALRGSAKKGGAGARDSCVASWVRGVADAFIEGVPGDAFALRGR